MQSVPKAPQHLALGSPQSESAGPSPIFRPDGRDGFSWAAPDGAYRHEAEQTTSHSSSASANRGHDRSTATSGRHRAFGLRLTNGQEPDSGDGANAPVASAWTSTPGAFVTTKTDQPAKGPLAGIMIADFSRVLAGPYCTMLLADLGADVIKIESPDGDDTRAWKPPTRDGEATYYLSINRNKRSIVLNLKDPDDRAVAFALASRADVVVENFMTGGMTKFGLDFPTLQAVNPGLIYSSITGFGAGLGAKMPGYDLMIQAISGLMSLTGEPDGAPYRAGIAIFDVMSGMNAAIGILAALHHRNATGEGQHVEVNLLSTALSGLVNHSGAFVIGDTVPFRMGNAHPSVFPYEPLPCSDGDLIVAVGNDGQFHRFCTALGIPELADDPRFALNSDRTANREQLRPYILAVMRTKPKMEWFRALVAAGVPAGPINGIDGGVEFAAELGLEPVVEVDGMPSVRNPIDLSASPVSYRRAPPGLGQHSDAIRAWLAATPRATAD
jgi:crotonobetainyl-CoA:carnitine CoA-transferase CaiB-like acyl-CoA transferase